MIGGRPEKSQEGPRLSFSLLAEGSDFRLHGDLCRAAMSAIPLHTQIKLEKVAIKACNGCINQHNSAFRREQTGQLCRNTVYSADSSEKEYSVSEDREVVESFIYAALPKSDATLLWSQLPCSTFHRSASSFLAQS